MNYFENLNKTIKLLKSFNKGNLHPEDRWVYNKKTGKMYKQRYWVADENIEEHYGIYRKNKEEKLKLLDNYENKIKNEKNEFESIKREELDWIKKVRKDIDKYSLDNLKRAIKYHDKIIRTQKRAFILQQQLNAVASKLFEVGLKLQADLVKRKIMTAPTKSLKIKIASEGISHFLEKRKEYKKNKDEKMVKLIDELIDEIKDYRDGVGGNLGRFMKKRGD